MAINSDKQLRDKLSNQEFPFDPQAWEQMEALLDKKKKRRGFFWWWTGGLAAVLLLSVGTMGWGLYLMEDDDKQMEAITEVKSSDVGIQNPEVNAAASTLSQQETERGNTKLETGNSNWNGVTKEQGQQKTVNKKQETRNRNSKLNTTTATLNEPSTANRQLSTANKNQKRENRNSTYETRNAKLNTAPAALNEPSTANRKLSTPNSKPETAFTQQEGFILSRQEASLLASRSDNNETAFDKKEEDALPKPKKKIFNYSLGCIAGVSFVTVGKQDWSSRNRILPKPSYQVGLTNDFLFAQRVALTTGFVFSQTSFVIANPKTTLLDNRMIYYTSKITEFAIPVGIKVYPVVKGNFRFYINTGIVNHIKLKETFSYTAAPDTVYNATLIPPNTTFPDQTNFNGTNADVLSAVGTTTSTADFSINRAKRYYASYYASAGFEYLAGGHWLIFGEPTFNMSLQKIGVQDKRKYNIGLNAGFRYQF